MCRADRRGGADEASDQKADAGAEALGPLGEKQWSGRSLGQGTGPEVQTQGWPQVRFFSQAWGPQSSLGAKSNFGLVLLFGSLGWGFNCYRLVVSGFLYHTPFLILQLFIYTNILCTLHTHLQK